MNENLNLVEILKDCPKGTKLYSTIYGTVELYKIEEGSKYPIILIEKEGNKFDLTADGRCYKNWKGECTLFPSKDQRDWSKFTAPWYKKEKSSLQTNEHTWLHLVSDVLTWKDGIGQYLDNPEVQEIAKRLCNKYAQKLYNPSVLSSSSNTVKNEQKFNPKTLQSFDKVLVRKLKGSWNCDYFSHIHINTPHLINTLSSRYEICIPYNNDTKHLVGTTDEAPEYYRYWEDKV